MKPMDEEISKAKGKKEKPKRSITD